jgi:single-strand DNA-binding protein
MQTSRRTGVRKTNTHFVYPLTTAVIARKSPASSERAERNPHSVRLDFPDRTGQPVSDTITLTGIVGTEPRSVTTADGLAITSFRLASTQRRFDKGQEKWVDGETNWYSITTFRQLATNAAVSVKKGERIIVTGKLRIRPWENSGKTGTNIEIEAESLGHDLLWGTAAFSRGAGATPTEPAATFPSEAELATAETTPAASSDMETPF